MKILIDETKIEYQHQRTWIGKVVAYTGRWFRNATAVIQVTPPYRYKGVKGLFKVIKPYEIGKTIKIEPKIIEKQFEIHTERLKLYDFFTSLFYFIFAFTVSIATVIFIAYTNSQTQSRAINTFVAESFNIISFTVGIASAILSARIVSLLLDKRFADSLVLPSSLYLCIDLQQYDDLSNPDFKRNILERLRTLRRNILLLSQTFTDINLGESREATGQLRNIESYIRERENWVIAPKAGTLRSLRSDFEKLAIVLISGQYGEFKSKTKRMPKELISSPPLSITDKILRAIATLFPYGILAILYFSPEYIKGIGLDVTTTFLVALAWILLTVDARLKLGLIDRVTGLAKTMKELK